MLETILKECDKNYIKEACCKMIIKFFGKENELELKLMNQGNEDDKLDFN
jgi:hypothetical protein